MKRFLQRLALFLLIPAITLVFVDVVLPPTVFTFRTWEAIQPTSEWFVGPFYPGIRVRKTEEGDLAHHTRGAIKKRTTWQTDSLGYRNPGIPASIDIVLIGDSFIAGTALSQEHILSERLAHHSGLSTYALAPAELNELISLLHAGLLPVPRLVVVACVERNICALPDLDAEARLAYPGLRTHPLVSRLAVPLDRLVRANSLSWLQSRIYGATGYGIPSQQDPTQYFLQGQSAAIAPPDDAVEDAVARIATYQEYCASMGAAFLFLPIPNKETIMWEHAGLREQPIFLNDLGRRLDVQQIPSIELSPLFMDLQETGVLAYHRDDAHWNQHAVDAAAAEMARVIATAGMDDGRRSTVVTDPMSPPTAGDR